MATTPNNIPQGYKATALGIIPQEWEVKKVKDICNVDANSLTTKTPLTYEFEYISLSDVDSDSFEISTSHQIFQTAPSRARRIVKKGDVVISTVRPNLRGFFAIKEDVKDLIASTGFAVLSPISCDTQYLLLYFYSEAISKQFYSLVVGSNYPAVNSSDVAKIKIAVPPLAEQRKIAEVLGVWDEAIEKQARLIEKLALRKRGLMQRLLSAKLRLPGFSELWKELKINKITTIKKGEQVNKDVLLSNAKYPVINGGITPSGYLDTYNTKENTITISEGGNSCGYVNFMTTPFWSGGHCYTIDAKDGINNLFIYQLLKNNEKYIMSLRVGSGLPNIQIKDLGNLKFMIPVYQEQTAIAEVLTAADREIDLAKEKLERLRRQKRGLMQQLLTGKKRVKY